MTTDFKIMFILFFSVVIATALLTGCKAPAVAITKIYVVHQYGAEGNRVDVLVEKDQDVSPTVTGAAIKAK